MQHLLPHLIELPIVFAPCQVAVGKGNLSIGMWSCSDSQEVILPAAVMMQSDFLPLMNCDARESEEQPRRRTVPHGQNRPGRTRGRRDHGMPAHGRRQGLQDMLSVCRWRRFAAEGSECHHPRSPSWSAVVQNDPSLMVGPPILRSPESSAGGQSTFCGSSGNSASSRNS